MTIDRDKQEFLRFLGNPPGRRNRLLFLLSIESVISHQKNNRVFYNQDVTTGRGSDAVLR